MAIPESIKQKANKIRNEVYGKDVREALASGIEEAGDIADQTRERQDSVEAQFQSVLDETTGKDVISAPEITAARVGADDTNHPNLKERLDTEYQKLSSQLAQTSQVTNKAKAKPMTRFVEKGIAFDSSAEGSHSAWPYDKLHYDKDLKRFVFFYMAGVAHGTYVDDIYMRTKGVNDSEWSSAKLVASHSDTYGLTCQAAEIGRNGEYLLIISRVDNTTKVGIGSYLYKSTDKGATWSYEEIRINNQPILAYNGDVNGLKLLKSGRLIAMYWKSDYTSYVIYSDDDGATWSHATIQGSPTKTVFEPAFVEFNNGTILAVCRTPNLPGDYDIPIPAWITKSYDGGLTWTEPFPSKSITDMNRNNGAFIYHEDIDVVEFICCSRHELDDQKTSIFQYSCSAEDALNDNFGQRYRIGYGPNYYFLDGSGYLTSNDFGYPAVAVSDEGYAILMYYKGTITHTKFYYMVGSYGAELPQMQQENAIDSSDFYSDSSQADGYVKLADGTLIQYGSFNVSDMSMTNAFGQMFISDTYTINYPVAFVGTIPNVSFNIGTSSYATIPAPKGLTLTTASVQFIRPTSTPGYSTTIKWMAIGRWKH